MALDDAAAPGPTRPDPAQGQPDPGWPGPSGRALSPRSADWLRGRSTSMSSGAADYPAAGREPAGTARAPLLPRAARAGSGMHDLFTPLSVGRFNRALQRRELEPVEAVPRQRQ